MNEKLEKILNEVNPEIMDSEGLDLIDDEIIDSLMIMRIVSMVEERFDIEFDVDDITPENFASPKTIWELIKKYKFEE